MDISLGLGLSSVDRSVAFSAVRRATRGAFSASALRRPGTASLLERAERGSVSLAMPLVVRVAIGAAALSEGGGVSDR